MHVARSRTAAKTETTLSDATRGTMIYMALTMTSPHNVILCHGNQAILSRLEEGTLATKLQAIRN
jgi:hypothetical protein